MTIKTIKNIMAGEELTVNYGPNYFEYNECLCNICRQKRNENIKDTQCFQSLKLVESVEHSFDEENIEDVSLIPLSPEEVPIMPAIAKNKDINNLILKNGGYTTFISEFSYIDRNVYDEWISNMKR